MPGESTIQNHPFPPGANLSQANASSSSRSIHRTDLPLEQPPAAVNDPTPQNDAHVNNDENEDNMSFNLFYSTLP